MDRARLRARGDELPGDARASRPGRRCAAVALPPRPCGGGHGGGDARGPEALLAAIAAAAEASPGPTARQDCPAARRGWATGPASTPEPRARTSRRRDGGSHRARSGASCSRSSQSAWTTTSSISAATRSCCCERTRGCGRTSARDLPIVALFQLSRRCASLARHLRGEGGSGASGRDGPGAPAEGSPLARAALLREALAHVLRRRLRPERRHRHHRPRGPLPRRARRRRALAEPVAGARHRPLLRRRARAAAPEEMAARRQPNYVRARGILDGRRAVRRGVLRHQPDGGRDHDPQQRLFLEAAWEALETRGLRPATFPGPDRRLRGHEQQHLLPREPPRRAGRHRARRLADDDDGQREGLPRHARRLQARPAAGPRSTSQTACSTSLVAVCHGRPEPARRTSATWRWPAGVSITLPQKRGYLHQEGGITSPDGHCRAFDETAAGTVFSNGVGIVVLQAARRRASPTATRSTRSSRARPQQRRRRKVSFTAPSVDGQADVIAMAQALAGIDPDTISYVEAHGTGTPLGDPDRDRRPDPGVPRRGRDRTAASARSARSRRNIGHLDAAAGVAGLIKTALALHHKDAPADPALQRAQPEARPREHAVLRRTRRCAPWPAGGRAAPRRRQLVRRRRDQRPRRARGGARSGTAPRAGRAEQLLVLSARSPRRSTRPPRGCATISRAHPERRSPTWRSRSRRAGGGSPTPALVVAASRDDADRAARRAGPPSASRPAAAPSTSAASRSCSRPGRAVRGHGRGVSTTSEPRLPARGRRVLPRCCGRELGLDLRDVLYPSGRAAKSGGARLDADRAHPAGAVRRSSTRSRASGVAGASSPTAMIGHSVGEYVAACLAGVFTRDDALRLVADARRLMQAAARRARCSRCARPRRTSRAAPARRLGSPPRTPRADGRLGRHGRDRARSRRTSRSATWLPPPATSHAFHSAMMDPILERLRGRSWRDPRRRRGCRGSRASPATGSRPRRPPTRVLGAPAAASPCASRRASRGCSSEPDAVLLEVGPGQPLDAGSPAPGPGPSAVVALAPRGRGASLDAQSVAAPPRAGSGSRVPRSTGAPSTTRAGAVGCRCRPIRSSASATGSIRRRRRAGASAFPDRAVTAGASTEDERTPMAHARANASASTATADARGRPPADLVRGPVGPGRRPSSTRGRPSSSSASTRCSSPRRRSDPEDVRREGHLPRAARGPRRRSTPRRPASPSTLPAERAPAPAAAPLGGALAVPTGRGCGGRPSDAGVRRRSVASASDRPAARAHGAAAGDAPRRRARPGDPTPACACRSRDARSAAASRPAAEPQPAAAPPTAIRPVSAVAEEARPAGSRREQEQAGSTSFVERYTRAHRRLEAASRRRTARISPIPRSVAGLPPDLEGDRVPDRRRALGRLAALGRRRQRVRRSRQRLRHDPASATTRTSSREAVDAQLEPGHRDRPADAAGRARWRRVCARWSGHGARGVLQHRLRGGDRRHPHGPHGHRPRQDRDVRRRLPRHLRRGARASTGPAADAALDARSRPGIPPSMVDNVLVLDYGSPAVARAILRAHGDELAAVLVEPVQSRRPELQPREFLHELRAHHRDVAARRSSSTRS